MQLRLTIQARRDLSDIWAYVAANCPDKADEILDLINERFRLIASYPLVGRARSDIASHVRLLAIERWVIL
ncbi:MAG TPA: type II toxin-antitoxin system RelE/ParE family toxin, partial [Beijerinckiaceae bacterium]|nr:type II toxin-antitoxin system RelE/ParE family toxin [Beijerinckiaceae bacterium]